MAQENNLTEKNSYVYNYVYYILLSLYIANNSKLLLVWTSNMWKITCEKRYQTCINFYFYYYAIVLCRLITVILWTKYDLFSNHNKSMGFLLKTIQNVY